MGFWKFLVHNAACLWKLAADGVKYAQDILRGIKFNRIMAERMGEGYVHELWVNGMKSRLDSFLKGGGEIISRKATQLAEITEETAKKYIDEIAKKYKNGMKIQNAERGGAEVLKGDYILQIPKQEKAIPQSVLDYANENFVKIDEVKDVTIDMLKNW